MSIPIFCDVSVYDRFKMHPIYHNKPKKTENNNVVGNILWILVSDFIVEMPSV